MVRLVLQLQYCLAECSALMPMQHNASCGCIPARPLKSTLKTNALLFAVIHTAAAADVAAAAVDAGVCLETLQSASALSSVCACVLTLLVGTQPCACNQDAGRLTRISHHAAEARCSLAVRPCYC
jgi:hypothetical protein